jgi:hypothetical protein
MITLFIILFFIHSAWLSYTVYKLKIEMRYTQSTVVSYSLLSSHQGKVVDDTNKAVIELCKDYTDFKKIMNDNNIYIADTLSEIANGRSNSTDTENPFSPRRKKSTKLS